MDYLDEQILELKRQQKKEKYQGLETGFYIRDELLEFDRVLLEPMDLSIMLPTTFATMPQSMVRVKYQSENRPQIIKTSLDTSVNFTFSLVPQQVRPEQLLIFAGVLTEMSIKVENQLRLLSATVRSGSYLMDLNPTSIPSRPPRLLMARLSMC